MSALLAELKEAMTQLEFVYARRDDLVRETNSLMIREHNLLAQIRRINVDLVKEG